MLKQEEAVAEIKVAEKPGIDSGLKPLGANAIHKGSKVKGDIVISQDLQLTGDIEGNITGENNASIFIKGSCKGNIKTQGSVEIDGEMSGGDISAGGYVKIGGKFNGGKIQAKERIHINGEFTGSLESSEIEVGANASGKGEIFYKDALSIVKGAKVEGKISRSTSTETDRRLAEVAVMTKKEEVKPVTKKGFFST
jgi:cytoskeletal protein CcmA (bactofilin family)